MIYTECVERYGFDPLAEAELIAEAEGLLTEVASC